MKRIYVATVLVIYIYNIFLAIGLGEPYCFQFTWIGSNDETKINCTDKHKHNIPCTKPFCNSTTLPNTTKIWEKNQDKLEESDYFCKLDPDNVCIRYTYVYNDAVVNVSYFCGKVVEDQTTAVTAGCYAQHTDGYTIEACACQSENGKIPCSATTRNTYSILITIGATVVTLFVYKIFNIP